MSSFSASNGDVQSWNISFSSVKLSTQEKKNQNFRPKILFLQICNFNNNKKKALKIVLYILPYIKLESVIHKSIV